MAGIEELGWPLGQCAAHRASLRAARMPSNGPLRLATLVASALQSPLSLNRFGCRFVQPGFLF